MSARKESNIQPILQVVVAILCAYTVLALTLLVYQTSFNPGLPIMLGSICTAIWALFRILRGAGIYYSRILDAASLLGVWMAVSAYFSLDAYLAGRSLATYAGALGFLFAIQCAVQNGRGWRLFAQSLVVFSSVVCVWSWIPILLDAAQTGQLGLLMGPFVNQDTFAIVPLIGLTVGFGLMENGSRLWRLSMAPQLALLFVSLLVTGCRAAMVGLGVSMSLVLVLLLVHRKAHIARAKMLLAIPVFIIVLFVPLTSLDVPVLAKWGRSMAVNVEYEEIRFELARYGWKAVVERPLLGSGPGTFGLAYQTVRPQDPWESYYINIAHNDPLEMAVETGIPGFLLWIGLFVGAVLKLYDNLKHGRRPMEASGVLASLVALFTFAMFNFIVSERPVFWLQFVVLGLAATFPSSRTTAKDRLAVRVVFSLAVCGLACWSFAFGLRTLRVDSLIVQAEASEKGLQYENAAVLLNRAIAMEDGRASLYQKRATVSARLYAYTEDLRFLEAQVYFLERARLASPRNVSVLAQLADAYVDLGDSAAEIATLDKARVTAPGNSVLRRRYVAALVRAGRAADAAALSYDLALRDGGALLTQLASLTQAMERQEAGSGVAFASKVATSPSQSMVATYFETLLALTETRKDWVFQRQLLELRATQAPDDLCLKVEVARMVGKEKGVAAERRMVVQLFGGLRGVAAPCSRDIVTRWVATTPSGQEESTRAKLMDMLELSPRTTWLRVLYADSLAKSGERKKAVACIREGLEFQQYSFDLLYKAGELYEMLGNKDLALSYYREALKAGDAQNGAITRSKIDSLLKR